MIQKEKQQRIFNNRYVVKKKLSQGLEKIFRSLLLGSFGIVYQCYDKVSHDFIALKIEKKENNTLMSFDREVSILKSLQGIQGIPYLFWSGIDQGYSCMAIQLLNQDLTYFLRQIRKFSLKCVVNLAEQLLLILEMIHKKGVVHRDIKPENILTGRDNDSNRLFIVDFGISKFYREKDGKHIPFAIKKPFIGTTRYASIAAHNGQELSRKDDLESLGYVLLYLLKGELPWQNIIDQPDQSKKIKAVGSVKMKMNNSDLCRDLPNEFQRMNRYFDYVKTMNFKSNPDYKYLRSLFLKIAISNNFANDKRFDWSETRQGTISTAANTIEKKNSIVSFDKKLERLNESSTPQSSLQNNYLPSVLQTIGLRPQSQPHQRLNSIDLPNSNEKCKSYIGLCSNPQDFLLQTENFQDLELNQVKAPKGRSFPRLSLRNNIEKNEIERRKKPGSIKYLGEIRERFIPDTSDLNDIDSEDSLYQRLEVLKKISQKKRFKAEIGRKQ